MACKAGWFSVNWVKNPLIMKYANSFTELEVYQLCRQLAKEIFLLTKTFPREETYSLIDQIRRSSRSIGAQIAEAWGRRRYEKNFVSKLTDAEGERAETIHWLIESNDCDYITDQVAGDLVERYGSVERMLQSMIDKSSSFCG